LFVSKHILGLFQGGLALPESLPSENFGEGKLSL
jgi:hypothetical protein